MRILIFIAALLTANAAVAQEHLVINGGTFDVTQDDDQADLVGLEYRYDDIYYGVRPMVGGFVTSDSGAYGYVGLHWDAVEWEGFTFSPNFAAGAFSQGAGKDLAHWIEFRSGVELSYDFYEGHKVGVAFNHLSNASIGDDNPGTETLIFSYQMPIDLLD